MKNSHEVLYRLQECLHGVLTFLNHHHHHHHQPHPPHHHHHLALEGHSALITETSHQLLKENRSLVALWHLQRFDILVSSIYFVALQNLQYSYLRHT